MSKLIDTIATKEDLMSEVFGLLKDLRDGKKEILRWMLFFAVTQTIITSAMLIYFLR